MGNPFSVYKPGQGMRTRWVLFGTLMAFFAWGAYSLYQVLTRNFGWNTTLSVGGADVFHSAIVSAIVLALVTFGLWRFCHGRRGAVLLIDTDQELKKVEWPRLGRLFPLSLLALKWPRF